VTVDFKSLSAMTTDELKHQSKYEEWKRQREEQRRLSGADKGRTTAANSQSIHSGKQQLRTSLVPTTSRMTAMQAAVAAMAGRSVGEPSAQTDNKNFVESEAATSTSSSHGKQSEVI
jgi:hypothetical protein